MSLKRRNVFSSWPSGEDLLKDDDELDVSNEVAELPEDFADELDLCLEAPVVPFPLKIELEDSGSPHRDMVKNVRERLERSHGRVTDFGLSPLGEIAELGDQDRSLTDLLTGSILQTPHLNVNSLPAFSPVPERCASPPPTNTKNAIPPPPCLPKAAVLKSRTGTGKKKSKQVAQPDQKKRNKRADKANLFVGPSKKRPRPTHFTFDGI